MKHINHAGIFFILLGFLAPFLSKGLFPSVTLFWLGLLLLMNENENLGKWNTIFKHGKIGLLFNVVTVSLLAIISEYYLIERYLSLGSYWFFRIGYYVAMPVKILTDIIIPQQIIELPNGGTLIEISYTRSSITDFLNSIFFVFVAIVIGKFVTSKNAPKYPEH